MSTKINSTALDNLKWSAQALAQPAEIQLRLFPEFTVKADELALDFDNWHKTAIGNHKSEFTEAQIAKLKALDNKLADMSGQEKAYLWTEAALQTNPTWEEIRNLAKEVLDSFGWPDEAPPTNRSTYIKNN